MTTALEKPEPSVRWIGAHSANEHTIGVVIVVPGRRGALKVIGVDPLLKVIRLDRRRVEKATPILRNGKPYPVKRAARRFLRMARVFGATKSARVALRAITKSETGGVS